MSDGSTIEVDVVVEADAWSALPAAAELIEVAVAAACRAAGIDGDNDEDDEIPDAAEIAVMLTDDEGIRVLNRDWRGKDKATNVLSFPSPQVARAGGDPHLGDIAIAYQTMEREAASEGKPLADHLVHLAVHGTLHLLGHDHEETGDAEAMEALERSILADLGVPDPYAETDPVV